VAGSSNDVSPGQHQPALASGNGDGFNFTLHMRHLCADLAQRLPELGHVDIQRVAIRFCQARKAVRHGMHATLTPLRFERGELFSRRRGRVWTIERLYDARGREMLYLLSFYLPRFLEHAFEEKLTTVVHELWHIGQRFDGDLRRHPGRCYAHSHSQKQYDALARQLALKWLSLDPPPAKYDFLRLNFGQLQRQCGRIFGQKIPTPKLIRAS
jgi:predicted metallopeptidase